jgi:protein arginine N-methyltransferase 1
MSFKDFNAEIDIIIGEPMGFCMHYDGMIDRMIEARDLYLDKKNGLIFPDKLKFKCSLINDEHYYDKKI